MDLQSASLIFVFISLVLSVSFHEAMHAFTAHWLGDDTAHREGRITLNPLAHIDFLTTILLPLILIAFHLPPIMAAKPVPFNPNRVRWDEFGAALVGLAGPFTNFVLAALGAGLIHILNPDPITYTYQALLTFVQINILLFVFNMLPLPPLDGSRLLYAVAPESLQRAMYQLETMGLMFLLPILFILMPVISPIISEISTVIQSFLL